MHDRTDKKGFLQALTWPQATLIVFLGVAGFFLLTEHKAHILGYWPYLILLLCPLMHVFMHKGRGHHDDHKPDHNRRTGK
jgi:hypothetical protein